MSRLYRAAPEFGINSEFLHRVNEATEIVAIELLLQHALVTYRMSLRRFTRLTNDHGKSLRHHTARQALFIAWYNFGRKHEALKDNTPAMASRVSDHVRTIKELIEKAAEA